jgi:uracil-DNA glycosylase
MTVSPEKELADLLNDIAHCTLCSGKIPAPNPVVRASVSAKILIIGQAPGTKVHASGIPWDDASGIRLRNWMGIDAADFYDESSIAIVPMGFCYPGKGKSGDLPPRAECAPAWHPQLTALLPSVKCTLLIGAYAQNHYSNCIHTALTERVKGWSDYAPRTFMLPHPSPRNLGWFKQNPWFDREVVPALKQQVAFVLGKPPISLDS